MPLKSFGYGRCGTLSHTAAGVLVTPRSYRTPHVLYHSGYVPTSPAAACAYSSPGVGVGVAWVCERSYAFTHPMLDIQVDRHRVMREEVFAQLEAEYAAEVLQQEQQQPSFTGT